MKVTARARVVCAFLSAAAMLIGAPAASSAQVSGPNLLDNPDFNWPAQTNSNVCAPGVAKDNAITPRAWTAFWTCKNDAEKNQDQVNRDPEFRLMNADVAEQKSRVRSYPTSASFFNFFSLQRSAGVLQNVRNIRPGTRMRFSAWVQLWSTNGDAPNSSFQPGGMQARVCIDTLGMTIAAPNFASPTIVCGAPTRQYDQFVQVWVEATAASDQVTVIVDTSSDFPVKHNDVFIDDAELYAIDGSMPAAPAAPVAPAAPAPAIAAAAPAVVAALPQINVREKPSYNAAIIAQATQGQSFPATAVTTDKQWFQIQFNGRVAYVHSSVVTPNAAAAAAINGAAAPAAPAPTAAPAPAAPAPPAAPAAVTVDSLPVIAAAPAASTEAVAVANTGASKLLVRQTPSAKGKVVAKVASGTRFTVLGVSPDKTFFRVRYDGVAGGEAWIMVRWTTPNEYAQAMLR